MWKWRSPRRSPSGTFRWSDENSGAHRDGGSGIRYRRKDSTRWAASGAHSYDDPNGEVVAACVRQAAARPAALADPASYRWIYHSTDTGSAPAAASGGRCRPAGTPPQGGMCVTGFGKPGSSQVACVRTDLTVSGSTSEIIWYSEGSGGRFRASMVQIGAPARKSTSAARSKR